LPQYFDVLSFMEKARPGTGGNDLKYLNISSADNFPNFSSNLVNSGISLV